MAVTLQDIAPADIEAESFRIIAGEIGDHSFDPLTFKVVQRVIHATGDFSFAENMRFSPGAIEAGIKAIRDGKNILTDVTMVAAGISKALLNKYGGEVICKVADPVVAEAAKNATKTRSEMAISMNLDDSIGIVAMGNAPTALVQAIRTSAEMKGVKPLLVGVPVGFVNAAESKALLVEQNSCYITSLGRKGGSPVAAAIVNALIRLAAE
ncbi:precorrin-8X methylmutase [Desulforhopalus sp. IMCC35007]|uniref:precorrin-8X methylmutase n=1 Tax=Desulforhopalus sp. IMCC35007 TaxID=2569543 RepID=UPI0010AE6AA7|nr:precorrin-8X methylmutase [Desulforhopalus sp. IMCC35007]TKB07175.1 precorrin-8X methylmutase [Desulforhopalus sp. IMCC35007]